MAVTAFASGTQSTSGSIGTELFLANVNQAGTYTLHVDTTNMAAGDVVVLKIYQMILTGGTALAAYKAIYSDAQSADDVIKISVPISNELTDTNSLRFSLNQTNGTARSFNWKILKYA